MGISNILAKWFSNYDSTKSVGSKLRAKRIAPLIKMIDEVYRRNGVVNIIDVGGTKQYWSIIPGRYLNERNVTITIVNLYSGRTPQSDGAFVFVEGDGCELAEFDNRVFDIAHSNSVIEHVGDWGRMCEFSKEVSRVAKNYFVQTPNFWFPIEPHCMTLFFHWLPEPIRIWIVLRFQMGHWRRASSSDEAVRIVQSARLLDKRMFRALFPDATILTEKLLLLPKSFIAIRNE